MREFFKIILIGAAISAAISLLHHLWGDKGILSGVVLFCVFGFNYEIARLKERISDLEFRLRDRQDRNFL